MLAVGVLGAPFQGFIQDTKVDNDLASNKVVYDRVISPPKQSVFGEYRSVDPKKVEALAPEPKAEVTKVQDEAKRNVLVVTAIFPAIMLVCYLGLVLYFRSKGGTSPR